MANEIKKFKPFKASYINYEGNLTIIEFVCENCKNDSCSKNNKHFFEGNFTCEKCKKNDINYYSNSFKKTIIKQLSLFNDEKK